jgi:hypothetical protein
MLKTVLGLLLPQVLWGDPLGTMDVAVLRFASGLLQYSWRSESSGADAGKPGQVSQIALDYAHAPLLALVCAERCSTRTTPAA